MHMELTALSYVDLVIQIAILVALVLDYFFIRKKSLRQHGALMTSAFVVSTILLIVIMLPPFLEESTEIIENVFGVESLLFLSHHVFGLVAELLGGFLVLRWVLKASDVSSCKGKNLMRAVVITWIVSILLGIVLFIWHIID